MKRHIMAVQREKWQEELLWEYQDYILRINTMAQQGAFHYHQKDWLSDRR
jgi:hypothetical protein